MQISKPAAGGTSRTWASTGNVNRLEFLINIVLTKSSDS